MTFPKPKPQSKPRMLLKMLRGLFAQHNHLAEYLTFMTERRDLKVCRIMGDASLSTQQAITQNQGISLSMHKVVKKLPLFDPTQRLMLFWYFFVFVAIVYYYVEMGLVMTYGPIVW